MSAAPTELRREISVAGVTATVLNIVMGAGLFAVPGVLGTLGYWAVPVIITCALVMAAVTLCFAESTSRLPSAGGIYGVVHEALGDIPAVITGGMLWLSGTLAAAGILAAAVDQVGALLPQVREPAVRTPLLVGLLASFGVIAHLGARAGARANLVSTVLKVAPLVLFALLAPLAPAAGSTAPVPPSLRDALPFLVIGIYLFAGLEGATLMNGEVREPRRTLPLGYGLALLVFTALAVAEQLAAGHVLGASLAGAKAPLVEGSAAVASWLPPVLATGAVVSMAGCAMGLTVAMPRIFFALAQDGVLPAALGRLHPVRRTPTLAIVVQVVAMAAMAVVGEFAPLAAAATLSSMAVYVLGCVATLRLRRDGVGGPDAIAWRVTPAAAVLAIAANLAIILTAERNALLGLAGSTVVLGALGLLRTRTVRAPA